MLLRNHILFRLYNLFTYVICVQVRLLIYVGREYSWRDLLYKQRI